MVNPTRLLLATRNAGKLREMQALLSLPGVELLSLRDVGIGDEVEEGPDYAENARRKAALAARRSGMWTVGDDSGLEVDALGGAPGAHSARLAGPQRSDAERRQVLLGLLATHARPWTARFRCTMALASPGGEIDLVEGLCQGEILPEERGTGGFGYDPIFLIQGLSSTMAEVSEDEKNRLSHRARAVQAMLPILRRRLGLSAS